MQEYRIEKITKENLHYLPDLYKDSFGVTVETPFFIKKFATEKFGLDYVGFLAIHFSGQAAAYYGVFPCRCMYNGQSILIAQSGDTMTHSEHRGKGLFITLAQATYQYAKQSGVKLIFGFPNNNSYPGFVKKLGWKHIYDSNAYKIKVNTLPASKVIKKTGMLKGFYDALCASILGNSSIESNHFENSVASSGQNYVIHNEDFYNYKKYYKNHLMTIDEVKIWYKVDGKLWIGDASGLTKANFHKIMRHLKNKCRMCGITEISFHSSPGTPIDLLFQSIPHEVSHYPIGFLEFSETFRGDKIQYVLADYDTF